MLNYGILDKVFIIYLENDYLITTLNSPHKAVKRKKSDCNTVNTAKFGNDDKTLYTVGENDNYFKLWDIRYLYKSNKKDIIPVSELLLSSTERLQIARMEISPDFSSISFLTTNNKLMLISLQYLYSGKNSKVYNFSDIGYYNSIYIYL